jgi:hypothetical protein
LESRLNLKLLKNWIGSKYRRIQKEEVESTGSIAQMTIAFNGMCNVRETIGHKGNDFFELGKKKKKRYELMKYMNDKNTRNSKQNNHRGLRRDNRYPPANHTLRNYPIHQDNDRNKE